MCNPAFIFDHSEDVTKVFQTLKVFINMVAMPAFQTIEELSVSRNSVLLGSSAFYFATWEELKSSGYIQFQVDAGLNFALTHGKPASTYKVLTAMQ